MNKNSKKSFFFGGTQALWHYLSSIRIIRAIRGQKSLSSFCIVPRLSRLHFLFFLLPTSYFLLLFSSSLLTNPVKTTISGTVKLEGQTNHRGVKVNLYNLVKLDTTLVRTNKQYPNIGVQISQETELYHREQTPVYTATTNKKGKWEIKDVDKNKYNIIAEREEYGFKYILNQNTENSITSININKLYI